MNLYKLEEIFFTLVKDNISNEIKTKYSDLQISTDPQDIDEAKFPTIFIQMIDSSEVGRTLSAEEFSGVRANYQIDVYSNKKISGKEVADEVMRVIKSLAFYIDVAPFTQFANGVYRTTIRCNRVIGAEDIL